jgi:hypothetical protein
MSSPEHPENAPDTAGDPPARRPPLSGRSARVAKVVAPVVGALCIGVGVGYAVNHGSGSSAAAGSPTSFAGGPRGSTGAPGGFGGGVAGEQHVQGTVTATSDGSVTVKSSSGTATYQVNATTEIVRNGQSATLADIQVGDPVFVHVYPSSSGEMLVERLFAGSSATDPGPGGPGFGAPPNGSAGTAGTT